MQYYHVWVRSDKYRGVGALTYQHAENLALGTIVEVPLRNERVLGFISGRVQKPTFAVKPIAAVPSLPPLPQSSLKLADWLQRFYASPVGVVCMQFLPPGLHTKNVPVDSRLIDLPEYTPVTLTAEQAQVLQTIHQPDTYLLHGRTGSGKTRIYIELAKRQFATGKSAIILSPEIGLTSQLASECQKVFGERVVVLHSQLTDKERQQAWLRILKALEPLLVIGPRSALFSPIRNLGLIVIDESHDQAYKQEQAPYYSAIRVAAQLRNLTNCILVLGSATPSVADYYLAVEKQKPILRLTQLATGKELKRHISIVDLKDRSAFARGSHLSNALITSIANSLERGEQALLFLNRRGTARVTLCSSCGWQALCPHCDLPLAYHGDSHRLRCHTCSYNQSPIIACPECGGTSISLRSFGTKAVVDETQRLFPEARILRLDTDSAKAERLENKYEGILRGDVDILVGTQMLTKGLDLPKLSTLGVILADSSLYLPDYTAQERTYQLLNQVIGRIGRGHTEGNAIIQTYDPKSLVLRAALHDDWNSFYNNEIAERKKYSFPPFCYLLKISCRRSSAYVVERTMNTFKSELFEHHLPIQIDGPTPAFHEKIAGKYQWQMVIKSRERSQLLKVLELLPKNWSYDLDPADLL